MKKIISFCKEKSLKLFSLILTLALIFFVGFSAPGLNAYSSTDKITYNGVTYSRIEEGDQIVFGQKMLINPAALKDVFSVMDEDFTLMRFDKAEVYWEFYSGNKSGDLYAMFDGDDWSKTYNVSTIADAEFVEMTMVAYDVITLDELVLEVFDSNNNSCYTNFDESGMCPIYVEVINVDGEPVINGGETAYVTNVDDPLTTDEIKATLTAYDNEDGDISSKIVVDSDNYSSNKNKVGTYIIVFSVTDTVGNKSILNVSVYVTDTQAATITGPTIYNADEKKKTSIDTLKGLLTFSDNYYELDELTITVESDNYSSNYNKLGTYAVTFKCVDPSGNISRHTINVKVNDSSAPVFSGPTSIIKEQSVNMTLDDIKAQITASDNGDGVLTSKITVKTDNYTGCGNKAGSYSIVFTVTDTAGNTAEHTVTVQVKDDIPPVWYVPNYCIKVSQLESLTRDDIVAILVASGQISGSSEKTINFTVNEYEGNENEPGMYQVGLQVKSADGTQSDVNLYVEVLEDEEADVVLPGEDETPSDDVEEQKWYEKLGAWFIAPLWFGWATWIWLLIGLVVLTLIVLAIVKYFKEKREQKMFNMAMFNELQSMKDSKSNYTNRRY